MARQLGVVPTPPLPVRALLLRHGFRSRSLPSREGISTAASSPVSLQQAAWERGPAPQALILVPPPFPAEALVAACPVSLPPPGWGSQAAAHTPWP